QATYEAYLRVIEEISRHDGSAGWNVMIWAAEGLFADYLDEPTAEQIFGGGKQPIIAGAISPNGHATEVPGGFSVAGRWSFASGCKYATWLIAGCVVHDVDGAPVVCDGAPDIRIVLLPASIGEILDTWQTVGLRGTGSHDFEVKGAFVPAEHAVPISTF